jgi:hypothetical protein
MRIAAPAYRTESTANNHSSTDLYREQTKLVGAYTMGLLVDNSSCRSGFPDADLQAYGLAHQLTACAIPGDTLVIEHFRWGLSVSR